MKSIQNGTKSSSMPLQCNKKRYAGAMMPGEICAPPAEWARAHPDRALRLLFVCPVEGPWLDEIIG